MFRAQLLQVYEFAVKEVLIHRVPLVDGGISPQKKKRKHRYKITPKVPKFCKILSCFFFSSAAAGAAVATTLIYIPCFLDY